MKHLLLMAFAILTIGCGEKKSDGVNVDELEDREGVFYLKLSNTPYTGKSFEFHENGNKKSELTLKEGKIDGLLLQWHANGQKKTEVNFKDGKEDGLRVSWYKDGQKEQESNWKDGQMDGTLTLWHKNGKKMAQGTAKGGKSISRQFWNSKGEEVDSMEKAKQ